MRPVEQAERLDGFGLAAHDAHDVPELGAPEGAALAQAVGKLERFLGREINYTTLTRKEFNSRRLRKDAFLEDVWRQRRIVLVGVAA